MKLELGVGSGLDGDVDEEAEDEELKVVEEGSGLVQFMKWKNIIFLRKTRHVNSFYRSGVTL